MSDAELLTVTDAIFAAQRQVEALAARAAGELQDRFEHDAGSHGIAAKTGCRNAAVLLTDVGQISLAEAGRLCRVGSATRPRVSLLGERMPAPYPQVAAALDAGALNVDSAAFITQNLAQAAPRATAEDLDLAEQALVSFATDNPVDSVRKLSIRYRDALDVDGIEPREEVLVSRRSLVRTVLPNGMKRYVLEADPVSAAFCDAAIDALVGAELRSPRFEPTENSDDGDGCAESHELLTETRTIQQMSFDAFVDIVRHALSCTQGPGPLAHTTVIVRMTLQSLLDGLGEAQLDGIEQPISAGTARRLAVDAHIIPMVLGGDSKVLDFGVGRRLFSHAQKLAIAERDGGCATAGCNRPASYTEAHHILWWKAHGGPTNLDNCTLLCGPCHHRIHREGWDILVKNNVIYFIPPASIDPNRRPRRGGRPPLPNPTAR
ncbi:HNH endonuclease [Cryobacterium frigoriphilum]|uniref:HNH endonuclease n=1 Tax=Cryobacterium frigoriphilum TaxID=1259150 RepID=A0A4V3IQQ0_9MICO|nr:HNH endonuclease signature motif containing protein [Cryobacterium frigoriphilum]TFD47338.1 HNH endonuclease [Cryobacterium frigoriphilum]